jgi:hypothetical protein
MIGEPGLGAIDPGRLDELLPTSMSQERKEAQVTAAPQMTVDFRGRLLGLLKARLVCKGSSMLDQELLRAGRHKVDLLDQRD